MTLRARWLQAGGLLALSVVLLGGADLSPYATCGPRSGLQPYVCMDYGDPWTVPLLFAGLASLLGGLALLWWLAGAWAPEHAATMRALLLAAILGGLLVAAAWSLGAPDLRCRSVDGAPALAQDCEWLGQGWQGLAYTAGGALVGASAASAAWLAFLRAR